MEPYDPDKRYFGPQGSPLCKLIPEAPPTVPQLESVFNRAAYSHDGGYEGNRRSGLRGLIKDYFERRRIDKKFLDDMELGIMQYLSEGKITEEQTDIALLYANVAYKAVRKLGWTFYRKGE